MVTCMAEAGRGSKQPHTPPPHPPNHPSPLTHPQWPQQALSVFAYLSYLLVRTNRVLRSEVARKSDLRARPLLGAAALLAVHVPVALLALRSRGIGGNMVLLGGTRPTQV